MVKKLLISLFHAAKYVEIVLPFFRFQNFRLNIIRVTIIGRALPSQTFFHPNFFRSYSARGPPGTVRVNKVRARNDNPG